MLLSYKFRLYPDKRTEAKLLQTLESCRWLFNHFLERRNEGWDKSKIQSEIPKLVGEHPFLKEVHSKTRQYVLWQQSANLKALKSLKTKGRKTGTLRFRGKGRFKTFVYNQSGFEIRDGKLHLSKIGDISMKQHREIDGSVKQVTIKLTPTGKWYAILTAECAQPASSRKTGAVGIDLGITHFATDSDGNVTEHPHSLRKKLDKLRKEQRRLSRKKKGSRNRAKQRLRVARVHEKVENSRRDFLHKLSRTYVNNYGLIVVEDLDVKGLVEMQYNSLNASDSSWSTFTHMLGYKAESAGVQLVKVDPKNTTQDCSVCGSYVHKQLWERTHSCSQCGAVMDRDYNAARNILSKALNSIGREPPESTPVEIGPLPLASLVVEAGRSWL
jgi:putative transposase